jgi:dTDP-4-dehydrorhamnose 3,5-epimerase
MLPGAKKDPQVISRGWQKLQIPIEGLVIREVLHVPGNQGVLTELFRMDWDPSAPPVAQVYQIGLFAGAISAWHCHLQMTDRLFVNHGFMKIVVFDDRQGSATHGEINEFYVGDARPTLIVIPPRVWHGVQNLASSDGLYLNLPSVAYNYEDPDHYRLPQDTPQIPYSWGGAAVSMPPSTAEP